MNDMLNYSPQVNIKTMLDVNGNKIVKDDAVFTLNTETSLNIVDMSRIIEDIDGSYQYDFVIKNNIVINVFHLPGVGYEINVLSNDPRMRNVQFPKK